MSIFILFNFFIFIRILFIFIFFSFFIFYLFSEFGVLDPNYKKRRIETEPSKRTEEIKNEETKEDKDEQNDFLTKFNALYRMADGQIRNVQNAAVAA